MKTPSPSPKSTRPRRRLPSLALTAPTLLLLAALLPPPAPAQPMGETRAPADAPSKLVVADEEEPGAPLVVTGTITAQDGNPVPAASLFVYQTGEDGIYGPNGNSDPRLRGSLRTDSEGRFELRTIRPGSYPGTRIPAHIHYHAAPPEGGRETVGQLIFADDPYLSDRQRRSSANTICSPLRDPAGILHCTLDIQLRDE